MVYNKFLVEDDSICDDTKQYLQNYLAKRFSNVQIYECGYIPV
jgi:hypothetical protein